MNTVSRRPTIALLSLGGTIASVGPSPLDVMDYPEAGRKLVADEILERISELYELAHYLPTTLRSVSSTSLSSADWFNLRRELVHAYDQGADGAIVLHGTSTLEETSYFLQLTLPVPLPVAVVGAQRPIGTVSSDAVMNIAAATRLLADPQAGGTGVTIVMDDRAHSARDGHKIANYSLDAFSSGEAGVLARVDGDRVNWYRHPTAPHTTGSMFNTLTGAEPLPRVDIVYTHLEADGGFIDYSVERGSRGLIVVGAPPGIATPSQHEAMIRASDADVAVVQSSRATRDRVPARRSLRLSKIIPGDDLPPGKARILLMCALGRGISDPQHLMSIFEHY